MEGDSQGFQLSPFLVAFIGIMSTGLMLLIYHCIVVKWCNRRHPLRPPHGPPFSPGVETMSGLDNSFIQLLPAYKYGTEMPIDAGECAVCLCEFNEGDEVRRLPECLHSFHVPCIDMWFYSHSNCPICRTDMTPSPSPQQAVQLESVPTFLYGAAHEQGRTLDSIRRELSYFKPNAIGNQWSGGPQPKSLQLKPDAGPSQATQSTGVVVVGATRWVDNYNVPVSSTDISGVRRIVRRVSGRGGGLASVQAMALTHSEDTIEVACNLLDPSQVGADQVQLEVERLAREERMNVGKGYFTDLSQEEIIENYLKLGFVD